MRRALRITLVVGVAVAVLAAATIGYVGWTIRRSYPQLDGEIAVAGLDSDVEVARDQLGIPTIYADTSHDLFYAQGYVHAQDRFWEMDFRRHVTAGRLAEWFGESQVDTDAFIRTMGWRRVAEQELPLLAPETRRLLEAYADGVNAYLGQRSGSRLSLEHWLLGVTGPDYAPEQWTPVDSLAWLKAMAWDLRSNLEQESERARLAAVLPFQRLEQLYPAYPYDRNQSIVTAGGVQGQAWVPAPDTGPVVKPASLGEPSTSELTSAAGAALADDEVLSALAFVDTRLDSVSEVLGPAGADIGSNSWVVSGSRTASGLPILANDPHLSPAMPSIWYQVNLRCRAVTPTCPYDVGGFSFSGFPGVIVGHTAGIAWGVTNLGPDVSDLYIERLRGVEYETPDGLEPFESRQETIVVAGGKPVTITVRTSRHGPLISDPAPEYAEEAAEIPGIPPVGRSTSYAVALRWTALDPGRTADAVFGLNQATNWQQFRAAARYFEVPSQNLVYADVEGNIGYQAPGRIPIRRGSDGRSPVPGWTGEFEWTGFIPFDALPYQLNPEAGYIVTANQAVVSDDYPYLLSRDWAYGYRSQRIVELLEAAGPVDVEAVQSMQLDTKNPNAAFLVPLLPAVGGDEFYAAARRLLDAWDYLQPAESAPAAYFNAVWRSLLARTFQDELPREDWPSGGDRWFEVVRQLWDDPEDPWWDDVSTPEMVETRDTVVSAALYDARDELTMLLAKDPSEWEWGRLHDLELEHATFGTSGVGLIEMLFNRGPIRVGGGSSIVSATSWDAAEGYEVTAVPSMRMVVDLADLDASSWINLTGQSGHPYHQNYVDQVESWRDGVQLGWAWTSDAVDAAAADRLVMRPRAQ